MYAMGLCVLHLLQHQSQAKDRFQRAVRKVELVQGWAKGGNFYGGEEEETEEYGGKGRWSHYIFLPVSCTE